MFIVEFIVFLILFFPVFMWQNPDVGLPVLGILILVFLIGLFRDLLR